jgi:hypothetical protein
VSFSDIESALAGSNEARVRRPHRATATVVVPGRESVCRRAAQAIQSLRTSACAVLISCGDSPRLVRVAGHTVALEGLRPGYLNNAVAALRLSSLPTLVWWRGGQTEDIQGLATLADRLVLDAEDPLEVWKVVENLAQRTSVSDLRWTRLTRWRALMAHFFDIQKSAPRPAISERSVSMDPTVTKCGFLPAGCCPFWAQTRTSLLICASSPGSPRSKLSCSATAASNSCYDWPRTGRASGRRLKSPTFRQHPAPSRWEIKLQTLIIKASFTFL